MKELSDSRTRKSGCYTCKYSKPETLHGRQETRCLLDNMLVMRPSKGCSELKIMTNGDRIRQMTDEELAEFIVSHANYVSDVCKFYNVTKVCRIIAWLEQEVSEDAGTD